MKLEIDHLANLVDDFDFNNHEFDSHNYVIKMYKKVTITIGSE